MLDNDDRPSFLDRKSEVASIRSNNPGAIWDSKFTRNRGAIGGQKLNDGLGQNNSIAYFDDAIDGARCLFQLLESGYCNRTVKAAIRKWCGGNHVQSYLSVLKQKANISPDDMITQAKLQDIDWAVSFARAMAYHEAGKVYPLSDLEWRLAHFEAFGLSKAPVNDPITAVAKKAAKAPVSLPTAAGGGAILLSGWAENISAWLQAMAAAVADLSPVKLMFEQAGANAQALTWGAIVLASFVAIKKLVGVNE